MDNNAVNFRHAFSLEHLIALVTADDIAGDFVPDDGIDIAEIVQTSLDFFVGRVARLEVFAGIVFCGFQLINADPLKIHLSVHFYKPAFLRKGPMGL